MNITVSERARRVIAYEGEKQIGTLSLYDSGEVDWVGVDKAHRRRGVATAMWQAAIDQGWEPFHSACREPEGSLWAASVGGAIPALHTLPCRGCFAS